MLILMAALITTANGEGILLYRHDSAVPLLSLLSSDIVFNLREAYLSLLISRLLLL